MNADAPTNLNESNTQDQPAVRLAQPSFNLAQPSVKLSQPTVKLEKISRLFGSFAALREITADLLPGKCYVLLGENGAGKSTLLRVLAGLLHPTHGTLQLFGNNKPHAVRERISYMSHAPMLYDELTGLENLAYFASLYPNRATLDPMEAMRQVGLNPELTRTFGQYSQGMRQRTSLARALLCSPDLLLLDEPFSNMDVESAHQMVKLLSTFRHGTRTIVLTTHQRELAAPVADVVLTLSAGRLISNEAGSPTL